MKRMNSEDHKEMRLGRNFARTVNAMHVKEVQKYIKKSPRKPNKPTIFWPVVVSEENITK